ncbi:outer membrane beta-barrel protein [Halpernia frigidisoli]|uniref:Opacity protein n=1 Tax=Halpernia frigidisoli TaxID=1125876 RepID=A0A1I3DL76_9FLAO|nr:outer membrane beta-barrel protein [Halpernia frigidisoli]SFH87339.1 Opacity protein [Halpernia frigidisoli]
MKKLLLTSAIAFFGLVSAQKAVFGANAGYLAGFAKAKTPFGTSTNNDGGFYAGFFAEFNAGSKLKIEPAINYVNIDGDSALQIPIVAKYYVDPKFNLQAGPQFLFDFSDNPYPDNYNTTNIGLALGAAYEFTPKLFLEGRYSFQLNDHLKNAPSNYSVKANYLNIGLGYRF